MAKAPKNSTSKYKKQNALYEEVENIIGKHPAEELFGSHLHAEDSPTDSNIPHRSLNHGSTGREQTVEQLRAALIEHHVSAAMIAQDRRKIKNLRALGYPIDEASVRRFPTSDTTRKGNLAEVFLAEYICAASGACLPVYRLRYNPNIEQSMKGDDVLAFDFTSKRPHIIIGEAKFRGTPSKKAIQDIVSGLVRSHQAGLPASLQFVADRLYELNQIELADRVEDCSIKMAQGRLDLSYVGLLLSDDKSKSKVHEHTTAELRSLVMISLGIDAPGNLVEDCFDGIEEIANADPD
ncbi:MAG: SAVED domain-containing protein [Proteiniphilum sp.]|jgi:hypothetical protein|nr:SAVED domain-containing protein [Proteiniphilum sp.]